VPLSHRPDGGVTMAQTGEPIDRPASCPHRAASDAADPKGTISCAAPAAVRPSGRQRGDPARPESVPVTELPGLRMLWQLQHRPLRLMRDLYDRPPGVFVASLLGRKYLVLSAPELVRRVLQENVQNYRKNYGAFREAVGRSSLVTQGEEWRTVRAANQKAFRPDLLREIVAANRTVADDMVGQLSRHAAGQDAVDIGRLFGALMIDVTARGMFARRTRRSPDRVFDDVDCFLPTMDRCAVMATAFGRFLVRRSRAGFTAAVRRWRDLPRQIRADPALRSEEGTLLAQLAARFDPDGTDAEGGRIIGDEIMLFLAAGSQTSAATLGFALMLLYQHPDVLRRVRAQLHELGVVGTPAPAVLDRLTVLANVVAETLRLFPPVWAISRVALDRDEIAGIAVKRNDVIIISYFGLHRSALHWPNPDRFEPARFETSAAGTRPGYVYLPFGAGPRACIGAQLAEMQIVSILAAIVSSFDVEFLRARAGLSDTELRAGISLWPKRPLLTRFTTLPEAQLR
jgi:cytochrome P450